jgi:LruC domain-containing protein
LPWALDISSSIPYMQETKDFTTGFNKFIDWSVSNGSTNTDWYLNLTGYRNTGNLY